MNVHPAAAEYPLLADDELASLADDIAANGLEFPIVIDAEGRVVDGRNRLLACEMAGVEPTYTTIDPSEDVESFILSANVERRSLSSGQRAMFRAADLVRQGKRSQGRWARGSVDNPKSWDNTETGWLEAMRKAGAVIDAATRARTVKPSPGLNAEMLAQFTGLPAKVKSGEIALDAAYRQAQQFDSAAALAELALYQAFGQQAARLEQISIDAEDSPLPALPVITDEETGEITEVRLKPEHVKQLTATARRLSDAAKYVRTYIEENK